MMTKKQIEKLPQGFTPVYKTGKWKKGKSKRHRTGAQSRKQLIALKDEFGLPTGKCRLITHEATDNRRKGFDKWKRKSIKIEE